MFAFPRERALQAAIKGTMEGRHSGLSCLVAAYDAWVQEENPEPAVARAPLRALQQAMHECHRRGGRLASVPLLLEESAGHLHYNASGPLKLTALLPELPPTALLS
jgi:hypothetical protein